MRTEVVSVLVAIAAASGIPLGAAFLSTTRRSSSASSHLTLINQWNHRSPQRSFVTTRTSCAAKAEDESEGDEEWHPRDPAQSTPQLLAGVWQQIAQGGAMVKGEESTVIYPEMEAQLNTPRFLNVLMDHLDDCKDVCDHFGISTALTPYREKGKIVGFTVKSYRNPEKDPDSFEFEYDPFWDDGTDFDELYKGIDDELEAEYKAKSNLPEIENKIPDDDDEIIGITKKWVSKLMSDMGICPFSSGSELAGLPIGPVHYCIDRATSMEDMYARYWKEVVRVEQQDEKNLSTTLLIAPEFYIDNVELFESFSNTLTKPLAALGVEELLQLVFFHPQWCFRDGGARAGTGQAANYARRSPWPMINILRTKQVRAAQKGIPTGLVYKQNEKTLGAVGVKELETMLRLRNWDAIADVKVDRRDMEALKIAQDFQKEGVVTVEDQSFANDATPAANKVEAKQVEQGNLVNVLMDALKKRLGKTGQSPVALSGPETSASVMATDFLLAELGRIEKSPHSTPAGETRNLEAAKQALLEDIQGQEDSAARHKTDQAKALFGGGGIPTKKDDADQGSSFPNFSNKLH